MTTARNLRQLEIRSKIGILGILAVVLLSAWSCTGRFPTDGGAGERARAAFDEQLLADSLERISTWHLAHDTGADADLLPATDPASITAVFAELPVTPTRELRMLWTRHNGQNGRQPLIWYHDLLSVESAAAQYSELRRNPLVRWDPRFVPVFQFQGEWYATQCSSEVAQAGPVVHFSLENGPVVAFTNLTTMMATMAELFDSGAVVWRDDGAGMSEDIRRVAEIHRRLNPLCRFPYWVDQGAQPR